MFRVSFFCDDKRLPAALHALMGIAHGSPEVLPVVNASKTKDGLVANGSGGSYERFVAELKKHKGKQFNKNEMRDILRALGLNVSSSSYYYRQAKDAGLLKTTGSTQNMTYKVL